MTFTPKSLPFFLYNTESRKKEQVSAFDGKTVRFYACGPTVYDFAHIGNFRAFVFDDIVRRAVRFFGMPVIQVMNLTDVDDKTIRGALRSNMSLTEFTTLYTKAFFEDLEKLQIERADHYPKATAYIPQMIAMIEKLLAQKVAYKGSDGSIYFAIKQFPHYGKLSHLKMDDLQLGASERIATDEYTKEHASDFVLWKAYDSVRDGKIFWESPFGPGRPGWHIECSVMAEALLGKTIDIHAGGVDLMFPHHENEIAQSEACNHVTFSRLWVHVEHLLIDHKKMSKSAGNFYTLRDLLKLGYSGRAIRYLLLQTHYRTQVNFTLQALDGARASLARIDDFVDRLKKYSAAQKTGLHLQPYLQDVLKKFSESVADDLNISEGLASLFDMIRYVNARIDKKELSGEDVQAVLQLVGEMDQVLGLLPQTVETVPQEVQELVAARTEARREKNWKAADELRVKLLQLGYSVDDTATGVHIRKL